MKTEEKASVVEEASLFNKVTQITLPAFTIAGFLLTSLKYPAWGLIANLVSQIFWLYSGYQAWKKAGQIGILVTAVVITGIVVFGVLNYWVF